MNSSFSGNGKGIGPEVIELMSLIRSSICLVHIISYIRKLFEELELIATVEGAGKGKYRFLS